MPVQSAILAPGGGMSLAHPGWSDPLLDKGAGMQIRSVTLVQILVLVVLGLASAGCQVVGDIFQAGMWVGVIVVVLILAVIGFIASKMRRP
jgi:uncharacterized membrane protein YkvI